MSGIDWTTVIVAAIATLPGIIFSIRTHKAVNSRMSELLEITRQNAASSATLAERDRREQK